MLKTRSRAAVLALTLALVALGIGGSQKYFRVLNPYTPEERAAGMTRLRFQNVRLHAYLLELTSDEWERNSDPHRRENVTNFGLVFAAVAAVGLLTYWLARPRRRPESAADYAERRGQSIPDGQAPPG